MTKDCLAFSYLRGLVTQQLLKQKILKHVKTRILDQGYFFAVKVDHLTLNGNFFVEHKIQPFAIWSKLVSTVKLIQFQAM